MQYERCASLNIWGPLTPHGWATFLMQSMLHMCACIKVVRNYACQAILRAYMPSSSLQKGATRLITL